MESPNLKRRLTAVLLADVVGYSRLMNVDEEGTHTFGLPIASKP
jgi:class 3 adenylate cyclase